MRFFLDLLIINISASFAFLLRQYYGDFIVKQAPTVYFGKYVGVMMLLNILYPFIFWVLGLYDRRQKRALLEEFILIFGVFSTSLAILIVFLFLGRLWWMSRLVLFVFWGLSILLLCLSRAIIKINQPRYGLPKIELAGLQQKLLSQKPELEASIKDQLSIIIVTYNSQDNIRPCLNSIFGAKVKCLAEVIVVDNNSSDNTPNIIQASYPTVKLIQNSANLGYPRAINRALNQAAGNLCLIINPDVKVIIGSIEPMLVFAAKNPQVGILGCKLLNEDGTLQYSVRRFLDMRTYLYRFTPLRGLLKGSAIEKYYLMHDWDHQDNRLVDWLLGGCMLLRRSALMEIGFMDEKFFLYFEDVDLCFRAWQAGWQVAYVADAVMIHKHMRTSANKLFNRATKEHFKSLLYFLCKHGLRLPRNCPSSLE